MSLPTTHSRFLNLPESSRPGSRGDSSRDGVRYAGGLSRLAQRQPAHAGRHEKRFAQVRCWAQRRDR